MPDNSGRYRYRVTQKQIIVDRTQIANSETENCHMLAFAE